MRTSVRLRCATAVLSTRLSVLCTFVHSRFAFWLYYFRCALRLSKGDIERVKLFYCKATRSRCETHAALARLLRPENRRTPYSGTVNNVIKQSNSALFTAWIPSADSQCGFTVWIYSTESAGNSSTRRFLELPVKSASRKPRFCKIVCTSPGRLLFNNLRRQPLQIDKIALKTKDESNFCISNFSLWQLKIKNFRWCELDVSSMLKEIWRLKVKMHVLVTTGKTFCIWHWRTEGLARGTMVPYGCIRNSRNVINLKIFQWKAILLADESRPESVQQNR